MDQPTATIIAAVIAAVGALGVALINARIQKKRSPLTVNDEFGGPQRRMPFKKMLKSHVS
jgi:hypothetical protein